MLITWRTYAIRIWAWQIIHWHGMNNTQIPGNTTDAENGFASWTCGNRLSSFESVILSPGCTLHHPVPGLSPGPSNQNLWAEARLGLIFLKALQVILKCYECWNHYFKRKGYHRKIQQGTLRGYKWGAETPNNQVAAGVISVLIVIIHIIITTAPMTSTDKPRIQVREERRTKRKRLRKCYIKTS